MERSIVGALKSAIHDHGPIDEKNLSSAAKRVYCQLKCWSKNSETKKDKITV